MSDPVQFPYPNVADFSLAVRDAIRVLSDGFQKEDVKTLSHSLWVGFGFAAKNVLDEPIDPDSPHVIGQMSPEDKIRLLSEASVGAKVDWRAVLKVFLELLFRIV